MCIPIWFKIFQGKKTELADKLVSASIFLRYLCPAILSPSLFGLVSEYPTNLALRNLTLIAKTLQTLANFTKFSSKENFMEFMNEFITEKADEMHKYLAEISEPPKLSEKVQTASNNDVDNEIDFGKELSCLHSYLEENWSEQMYEKAATENKNMEELRSIVAEIKACQKQSYNTNSSHGTLSSDSTHSSANPPSDYENNGKSANPSQSSQRSRASSSASKRTTPASSLNTSDDYVASTALPTSSLNNNRTPVNMAEVNHCFFTHLTTNCFSSICVHHKLSIATGIVTITMRTRRRLDQESQLHRIIINQLSQLDHIDLPSTTM